MILNKHTSKYFGDDKDRDTFWKVRLYRESQSDSIIQLVGYSMSSQELLNEYIFFFLLKG